MGRVQAALDLGEGLSSDEALAEALEEASTEVRAEAEALGQIDAALRAWPQATLGDDAAEALASRIEQRLDEDLPRIADPTDAPAFDDADANRGAEGVVSGDAAPDDQDAPGAENRPKRETKKSPGAFSLANLTSLSVRDMPAVSPSAPLKRPPQKRRVDATQPFDLADAVSVRPVAAPQPPAPPPAPAPRRFEPTGERASIPLPAAVDLGGAPVSVADLPPPPADLEERRRRNRTIFYVGSGFAAAAVAVLAFVSLEATSPSAEQAAMGAPAAVEAPEAMDEAEMEEAAVAAAPALPVATQTAAADTAAGGPADRSAPEPSAEAVAPAEAAPSPEQLAAQDPSEGRAMRARLAGAETPSTPRPAPASRRPRMARGATSMAATGASSAPSRAEVTRALRAIQPAVSGCANGRTGVVTVNITVASSGRVRNAVVQGEFAGTRQGSCVARAVRSARFPAFEQDSFSIRYPFRF